MTNSCHPQKSPATAVKKQSVPKPKKKAKPQRVAKSSRT